MGVAAKREKMSKSRGNVVTVDEVLYGVSELAPGHEFRDERGETVEDFRSLGVWRDRGDTLQFYTATRLGKRPVFLHERGNPVPAALATPLGNIVQHPRLRGYWRRLLGRYGPELVPDAE